MPKTKTLPAGQTQTPAVSVLVVTPRLRLLPRAHASHEAMLAAAPVATEWVELAEQPYPPPDQRNVLAAYDAARALLLDSTHTHLLCLEDDMVVPEDTLTRLLAVPAPVAYALYTWRRAGHPWSAYRRLWQDSACSWSEDQPQTIAQWQREERVIETAGLGLGCTLIARAVLERIPWRLMDPSGQGPANDWTFALDCQAAGIRQMHDLGAVCGHILPDGRTVWPASDAQDWASHRFEEAA